MHAAQKEQIEVDQKHLEQMDATNEQLCADLLQADAELSALRTEAASNGGEGGADAARAAARLQLEKAEVEAALADAQRQLAELRNPPEPASGLWSIFSGKDEPAVVVNDADVAAATANAVGRCSAPGDGASRTAEVCRRLETASDWLKLAPPPDEAQRSYGHSGLGALHLSQLLSDLLTPACSVLSHEAEAAAAAATRVTAAGSPATARATPSSDSTRPPKLYRCVARTTVRAGVELSSAKTAVLALGEEVSALEEVVLESGVVRVRVHTGWVSKVAKGGGAGSRLAAQNAAVRRPCAKATRMSKTQKC